MFVYGTLRSGFWNNGLMAHARLAGKARTRERYALHADRIPYVAKEEDVSRIVGEVYEVDGKTLALLDRLEGHPDWYRGERAPVEMEDGAQTTAWLYFNPQPSGRRVDSGDYADAQVGSR